MFKINIKSGGKKITYKPFSVTLKYLVDESKLKESLLNLARVSNVKLSELQKKNFLSKEGSEIRVAKPDGKPDEIIISKVKIDDKFSPDYFRNHLAGILPSLSGEQISNLHIFIPKYEAVKKHFKNEEYFYQTFVEGILLGNYSFEKYKSDKKEIKNLTVWFYADNPKKLKTAITTAQILIEGVYFSRDLQNEPAINLTPALFANRIKSTLTKNKIKVTVFNETEIVKRKMGGLMAVGMGSENPPRFIIMKYSPAGKKKSGKKLKKIALVGKGVTFDSGGISIKPAANMGEMKADMSGAAVVAGTLLAAAKANLNIELLGIIPSAENMLSGKSMRPGDIVKTASGKTIEIDNTDAEGRMILADGLDYASKAKPDQIIDLATLTGACVVALGDFVGGLFTKNDELADNLYNVSRVTYERIWRLPIWDDYHKYNKSEVADVKNNGGRWGGAISAAKFLENFVDSKITWAHLDIAGPSMQNDFSNYSRKYMTGFGVRLLFNYLKGLSK